VKPTRARGFTLIELLVVMAILSILFALMMPAIQTAKERAREGRCKQNMKSIANVMMIFAGEHDDHLPAAGQCMRNTEWDWTFGGNVIAVPTVDPAPANRIEVEKGSLWSYLTSYPRVGPFGDPSARGMAPEWYASPDKNPYLCPSVGPVGRKRGCSYAMNYQLDTYPAGEPPIGIQISRIRNLSRKVLFVDESEQTINDGWFVPQGHENDVRSPEQLRSWLKHNGGANMAFCDGHIAWIERDRFLKMLDSYNPNDWLPLH